LRGKVILIHHDLVALIRKLTHFELTVFFSLNEK